MSRGGDSNEPAWLQETTQNAAVAVASNKEVQKAVTTAATDHINEKFSGDKDIAQQISEFENNLDPEELQSMKKMNMILRLSFSIVAICMCTVAVTQILSGPSIEIFFLASYVMVFAVIMCCFEAAIPG